MDVPGGPYDERPSARLRIAGAMFVALVFCLGVYLLLEATQPVTGLISFSFLLILPAAISAFLAYVADLHGEKPLGSYLRVPLWLLLAVIILSAVLLQEGVICIVILSPLWLASGLTGAWLAYRLRKRSDDFDKTYCCTLLLLPLFAMQVEPLIPLPQADMTVTRSLIVDAPAARIWPLLRGIPDVRADEGRWNITQDVLGVPRPFGAHLVGEGVGADRFANWGRDIRFRERIIDWQPGSRIEWKFLFDQIDGWRFTDRHLMPDSAYFRVTTGGYRLEPLGPNRSRLIINTRYQVKTPVNFYSAMWGEFFLGDLENNLLALVKQRAEALPAAGSLR